MVMVKGKTTRLTLRSAAECQYKARDVTLLYVTLSRAHDSLSLLLFPRLRCLEYYSDGFSGAKHEACIVLSYTRTVLAHRLCVMFEGEV